MNWNLEDIPSESSRIYFFSQVHREYSPDMFKHFFWPQCFEIRNQLQGKKHKHMDAKQYAANNQWITEEINKEIKKYLGEKWQWKHDDPKTYRIQQK